MHQTADVEVFTSDRMLAESPGRSPPADLGYPVHYLRSRRFFGERLVLPQALWPGLRRFDPDAIWTNHPSLTSDFAAVYARLRGVPWVATYHADLDRSRPYARLNDRVGGWILRRAQGVIVSSEAHADRLRRRGVPAERIRLIPLAIHIGRGVPPEAVGPGVPDGATSGTEHPLLFVGGLDTPRAYKHPEHLLSALRILRDSGRRVVLDVVGDGDRRPELEQLARGWGLAEDARFLGRLDDAALAQRYHRAWALVLPSSSAEGFGVVALEATYYGCPTVCSDAAPVGPFLERRGCSVLFPFGDASAMAEAIWSVWNDPTRRRALATAARQVGPGFTWEDVLPPTRDLLMRTAETHRALRRATT